MLDFTIRPTAKFIVVRTVFCTLIFLAVEIAWYTQWREKEALHFLPMIAPLIFISPALQALRRRFTVVTVSGDRLRYETGMFAKSARTIQLSKIQDVTVRQGVMQRTFEVGDISIETAGTTSFETIRNVDNPQAVADQLLDRAHQGNAV